MNMKRKRASRPGFTLVEILVAMVVLSVLLVSVAALTFEAARGSIVMAGDGYRQGVMLEEINRLTVTPYQALPMGTNCRTSVAQPFPHTICVTVAVSGQFSRQLTVVLTPAQPGVRPDTVVFVRANAPFVNPLFM